MKTTPKPFLLTLLLLAGLSSFSQTQSTIDSIDQAYQNCIDNGVNMLACSKRYYNQMDSLLNIVYKKIRTKGSASQQSATRAEQVKWLADKEKYFRKIDREPAEGLEGDERLMVIIDKKAAFVSERVQEIIAKLAESSG